MIIETNPCFQGTPVDNSLVGQLLLKLHTPSFGEGWVLLDEEGIPCVLPWLHVDDLLLHGPTLSKTTAALNFVMDEALRSVLSAKQRRRFCLANSYASAVSCMILAVFHH